LVFKQNQINQNQKITQRLIKDCKETEMINLLVQCCIYNA